MTIWGVTPLVGCSKLLMHLVEFEMITLKLMRSYEHVAI
jgi:hypothetical protein